MPPAFEARYAWFNLKDPTDWEVREYSVTAMEMDRHNSSYEIVVEGSDWFVIKPKRTSTQGWLFAWKNRERL